jgi:hypothetical protein
MQFFLCLIPLVEMQLQVDSKREMQMILTQGINETELQHGAVVHQCSDSVSLWALLNQSYGVVVWTGRSTAIINIQSIVCEVGFFTG